MSSVQFNFPPESYSAVYKVDGTTNANVLVEKGNLTDSCELSVSPAGASLNSSSSLFSCFHCAFQNGIKFTRRGKHKKENHTINHKGILSQISKQKAGAVPPLPEVSIDVNGVT